MKKRLISVLFVVALLVATVLPAFAGKPSGLDNNGNGKDFVTETGFDEWGYNYGAHLFSGDYCDAYKGASWCQEYVGTTLIMKWNDAWLSGSDLNGDGKLDRHFGYDSYIGSGAWTTNHMSGWDNGVRWVYFAKIVAKDTADQDCTATGGVQVWNDFCVIEEVQSGQGVTLLADPGLGN